MGIEVEVEDDYGDDDTVVVGDDVEVAGVVSFPDDESVD